MLGILGLVMIAIYFVTDVKSLILGAIFLWILDTVENRSF